MHRCRPCLVASASLFNDAHLAVQAVALDLISNFRRAEPPYLLILAALRQPTHARRADVARLGNRDDLDRACIDPFAHILALQQRSLIRIVPTTRADDRAAVSLEEAVENLCQLRFAAVW